MSAPNRSYRLTGEPGSLGLSCAVSGLALAGVPLMRVTAAGIKPRPAAEIGVLAKRAYGDHVDPTRLMPGLEVVAQALNRADLGRGMVAALGLRLPELDWSGAVRIAQAERGLTKYDPSEPRDWRGRWTTGAGVARPTPSPIRPPLGPEADKDSPPSGGVQPRSEQIERDLNPVREVRPETLTPIATGEDDFPPRMGGNGPPADIDSLRQIFPWLPGTPASAILAPIDGLLDLSGPGNAANEAATRVMRDYLIAQIKAVNPHYVFESFDPGRMPTTWQGRANLINDLLAERAAALYRFRGEVGPLQVETLRFLQTQVDAAYVQGVKLYNEGRLDVKLSRGEAIGSYIDRTVRKELRSLYDSLDISWRSDSQVRVNAREYDTSMNPQTYRIPDSRVGDVAFEVSLTQKGPSIAQIRGFFSSDFRPNAVVVVRPSQFGHNSTYLIVRPAT